MEQVRGCSLDNGIHAAKLKRMGGMYEERAKVIRAKLRSEVQRRRRLSNNCGQLGVKNLSEAIGEKQSNSLMCVAREGH